MCNILKCIVVVRIRYQEPLTVQVSVRNGNPSQEAVDVRRSRAAVFHYDPMQ